jgi:hypothetical protein
LSGPLLFAALLLADGTTVGQPASAATEDTLIKVMAAELKHSMDHLVTDDGTRPYFLAYTITRTDSAALSGSLGALEQDDWRSRRLLDVDVRVGDYALDNTRQIRGGAGDRFGRRFDGSAQVPLEDNSIAVQHAVWQATDGAFKSAVERFQRVRTDLKTTVEEEHKADDFSREKSSVYSEPDMALTLDRDEWGRRIRNVSRLALKYPLIYESSVAVVGVANNRSMVSSEDRPETFARRGHRQHQGGRRDGFEPNVYFQRGDGSGASRRAAGPGRLSESPRSGDGLARGAAGRALHRTGHPVESRERRVLPRNLRAPH